MRVRRPSAALVVAVIALVVSLAGVGYAAVYLPAGSVGTKQLRDGAVSNSKLQNGSVGNHKLRFGAVGGRKIINGAVGKQQINPQQVQARVGGVCTVGALTSISQKGAVTCAAAPGGEFNTATPAPVTLGAAGVTQIASVPLDGGIPYLLLANPEIYISAVGPGAPQSVEVDCTLSGGPSGSATQSRSVIVDVGSGAQAQTLSLQVPVPAAPNTITATLVCSKRSSAAVAPAVTVTTEIDALQTSRNTSEPYAG
jgi:hypothetical protein